MRGSIRWLDKTDKRLVRIDKKVDKKHGRLDKMDKKVDKIYEKFDKGGQQG